MLSSSKHHVVLVGVGNIGSHLVPHLGRMAAIGRVTLIDHDSYGIENLACQDIAESDLGQPKVEVQARRLKAINPRIEVAAMIQRVESVPMGVLRAKVVLSALDSRRSRQYLNEAVWRLGGIWIDSGVNPAGFLARANAYAADPENACYECAFSEQDYERLEQIRSCSGNGGTPAPTRAASALGGLAAALEAIECHKLLTGENDKVLFNRQVTIDARSHQHWIARLKKNPRCRFDHEVWNIKNLDVPASELSLREVFALTGRRKRQVRLQIPGKHFVTRLHCPACGKTCPEPFILVSATAEHFSCPACGHNFRISGQNRTEYLESGGLSLAHMECTLESIGLQPGDVIAVGNAMGRWSYWELAKRSHPISKQCPELLGRG
jgi:adenylyltransferase/sulfurtransferase